MKVGDMVKVVTEVFPIVHSIGLIVSIDRRHGVDCNRHSRAATIVTSQGTLITSPLGPLQQIEVISESW